MNEAKKEVTCKQTFILTFVLDEKYQFWIEVQKFIFCRFWIC